MRKALIGLMMAATAMMPIASASAQEQGGDRQAQLAERQAQRAERQAQRAEWRAQRSEGQTQRSEGQTQRFESRMQRFERRAAPIQVQSQGGVEQPRERVRLERSAPRVNSDSQPVPTRWRSVRAPSEGGRGDETVRIRRREAPVQVQSREVQTREFRRNRWQGDGSRSDGDAWLERREGRIRVVQPTEQVQDGEFRRDRRDSDRTRIGDRRIRVGTPRVDGDRTWDGNRTGSWDGRNYRWNRDGRRYSWNHDWRRDRRYDWNGYRRHNRFVFRVGPYYSPYRNYSYRRFSIGFFLQPLFFSSNYWISDPWQYRLPYAPPGTRWVRYYDDVLLVDVYTGEVIDVIYDFFW